MADNDYKFLENVVIINRGGTSDEWKAADPVLRQKEIGIDMSYTPARFKIGDGVSKWSALKWAGTVVAASSKNGYITVNGIEVKVYEAPKLTAADIPTLTLAKISDAGTAASKNVGTAVGNVIVVGADGKISATVIPKIAITDTFTVASEAAMLALSNAETGDVAIRSDLSKSFILAGTDPSKLADWQELLTPADKVQSVNGKTGTVILTTDDIAEGSNRLYYTNARADARVQAALATLSVSSLTDGATVITTNDKVVINGGKP